MEVVEIWGNLIKIEFFKVSFQSDSKTGRILIDNLKLQKKSTVEKHIKIQSIFFC